MEFPLKSKTFHHYLVPATQLIEETTDSGRIYITPTGECLRSVTTILSDKLDKSWLIEWRRRIGPREAKRISEAAIHRGTLIHGICERYVSNDPDYLKGVMPLHTAMFMPVKQVLDEHVDHIFGIEIPLYSLSLKTAGRTDLVAKYDGITSIIDYKTSKKLKTEGQILSYFLQSTVYSMMFEWKYKIPVPQIAIIITVDNEPNPQVFIKDRSLYIKKVFDIFVGETS